MYVVNSGFTLRSCTVLLSQEGKTLCGWSESFNPSHKERPPSGNVVASEYFVVHRLIMENIYLLGHFYIISFIWRNRCVVVQTAES